MMTVLLWVGASCCALLAVERAEAASTERWTVPRRRARLWAMFWFVGALWCAGGALFG
jgi:Na+/proline symporter